MVHLTDSPLPHSVSNASWSRWKGLFLQEHRLVFPLNVAWWLSRILFEKISVYMQLTLCFRKRKLLYCSHGLCFAYGLLDEVDMRRSVPSNVCAFTLERRSVPVKCRSSRHAPFMMTRHIMHLLWWTCTWPIWAVQGRQCNSACNACNKFTTAMFCHTIDWQDAS